MGLARGRRVLLAASVGVATVTVSGCSGFTSGNLMAPPPCPDGQVHTVSSYDATDCADECLPGTAVRDPQGNGYDTCEAYDAGTPEDLGQDAQVPEDGGAAVDAGGDAASQG